MSALDALWHLLNFVAPAFGMGLMAAALAKLLWWRDLRAVPWWRMGLAATVASLLALVAGLVWSGRDGRMATYGAMVIASAAGLWWAGWRARR